ncbi:hypothetical protein [Singulisphaera sp. GP187]|uniref:hypothetical protein n=1 Tax=Singulisphaera sp. GP187 TaxID=1882752 RepID=UPI0011612E6D|nr:hypothetical protein [Singulisphaera sp. GP187]
MLSFEDVYFGVTMAAIWTPNNPAVPCGDGGWVAYHLFDYPGSGGGPGHCSQSCPPGNVALKYVLTFNPVSHLPVMTIYGKASTDGCPNLTGTIPDGPWDTADSASWSRISWSCTPTFSATFGKVFGSTFYDCKTNPAVRILVTTP